MANATLYYTHNLNPRVAVATARYLRAPVDYVRYEPMGRDQEAFRPLNPNTLAPLLVEAQREPLWEADAIALRLSRLADPDFWPLQYAEEMQRWVSWSTHHFTRAGDTFYFERIIVPQFMNRGPDDAVLAQAGEDFARFAAVLDDVLAGRDWLVGGRLTYADFRTASALPFAERAGIPVAPFANIRRWHDRLLALDAWRAPFEGLDAEAVGQPVNPN